MAENPIPDLEEVCRKALRLPCAPSMLPRLAAALQSDETSAAQIERLISLDASLAAATLRLANSAVFGRGTVDTVEGAIFRLGAKEIYRLAALALVGRWGEGITMIGREKGDFSRHALCTAIAAEVLAQATELVSPQLAYTAGMVSDIGRLAIAHSCNEFYPQVASFRASRNVSWEAAERSVLGYNHSDISRRLLATWNFPVVLVQCAEFLTNPQSAPADTAPLLAHVHAARYLAASMGPGAGEEDYLSGMFGSFLAEWKFTPELLEAAMPTVLERAAARLGDKLSTGAITM
jgi:HD-like signal output (HDOD) protein